MSRRMQRDAAVVGGGVVGTACALALAEAGLQVALVDAGAPARWSRDEADLRVFAFAHDNAALLSELGVWDEVASTRAQPYRRIDQPRRAGPVGRTDPRPRYLPDQR